MGKVFIIDDDPALQEILSGYLGHCGHEVETALGALDTEAILKKMPDLVLLDVMMPGEEGWEVLRSLRRKSDVPVIMMTAKSAEGDVLQGFTLGADDYVTKPFSFAQLEARIRALLGRVGRRSKQGEQTSSPGGIVIDLEAHRVMRGDEVIRLTPTEFKLLAVLAQRPGKVVSSERLVAEVWGAEYAAEVDYVRRYIWHLRRKLEADPASPVYLQNERNVGYYLNVP
jgi:DNA-binding response OmpR family regulator